MSIENTDNPKINGEQIVKKKKPGIIYLSSVPYGMNISGIQAYFSKFAEVSNIFFQQAGRENCKLTS